MSIVPDSDYKDPRRLPLLKRLDDHIHNEPVSLEAWAMLWGCPIERLESFLDRFDKASSTDETLPTHIMFTGPTLKTEILKPWLLRKRGQASTSNSQAGTPTNAHTPTDADTPTRKGAGHRRVASTPVMNSSLQDSSPAQSTPSLDFSVPTNSDFSIPTNSENPKRDWRLLEPVHDRDKGCILTRAFYPKYLEVTHIYPISMSTLLSPSSKFWGLLRMFYTQAEIDLWEKALFTKAKTKIKENLMTMSATLHKAWDNCLFALLPLDVNPEKTKMKVQFFWLKIRPRGARKDIIPLCSVPDSPANLASGYGNLKIWNCNTERKINSGDIITLTTTDPTNQPLPSRDLLWMRWHLNRMAALCGGAEAIDTIYDDDDDEIGDTPCVEYEDIDMEDYNIIQLSRPSSKSSHDPFWMGDVMENTPSYLS